MKPIAIVLTALFFGFYLRRKMGDEPELQDKLSNGAGPSGHTWDHILDQYGIPFGQFCVATIYSVYMNLTAMNMLVFVVKYIPTGLCMYNFVKGIYVTSRDRQRRQQLEFEDIQLQITIINTKLCVREAECAELTGALRREAARLRGVRARVREAIAADAALAPRDRDRRPVAEDPDLTELLKELKYDQVALAECHNDMLECGEHAQGESPEHSVYSSLSDPDVDKECRVKIVKVTNVYKVAYLKHYIKQKRLRRASKQALLKKKHQEAVGRLAAFLEHGDQQPAVAAARRRHLGGGRRRPQQAARLRLRQRAPRSRLLRRIQCKLAPAALQELLRGTGDGGIARLVRARVRRPAVRVRGAQGWARAVPAAAAARGNLEPGRHRRHPRRLRP
ncbi:uncharacterized protein isoform X2 [Choristoneura fumiferana]|uniref:uncharacterized protein isoform X2 n=1 Tax=Choristoneura fumiferana TaxID=7141 RepID=UPI003D155978